MENGTPRSPGRRQLGGQRTPGGTQSAPCPQWGCRVGPPVADSPSVCSNPKVGFLKIICVTQGSFHFKSQGPKLSDTFNRVRVTFCLLAQTTYDAKTQVNGRQEVREEERMQRVFRKTLYPLSPRDQTHPPWGPGELRADRPLLLSVWSPVGVPCLSQQGQGNQRDMAELGDLLVSLRLKLR